MTVRFPNRSPRPLAELKADSGTVRYDLDMLVETAGRYAEYEQRRDIVGMNMAVESFAIHCRAMIHFVFGHLESITRTGGALERFSSPRPNDVFAQDYHPGWHLECPAATLALGDSKWRADKHVAHVTTDRRGVNQVGTGIESVWDMRTTVNELGAAMALFVAKAPPSNFDPAQFFAMKARLAHWISPPPSVRFIAKSGPLDNHVPLNMTARTDARTTTPPSP